MGLFLCIATAIAFYGYFNHIATIRIYWKYDFVLHYQENKVLENVQDCFYIACVIIYLPSQLNYLLRVAPEIRISVWLKWVILRKQNDISRVSIERRSLWDNSYTNFIILVTSSDIICECCPKMDLRINRRSYGNV